MTPPVSRAAGTFRVVLSLWVTALGLLLAVPVLERLVELPEAAVTAYSNVVQLAAAATAAVAAGVQAGRSRRNPTRGGVPSAAWSAYAVACGGWALGQALWTWDETVVGRATPFPSVADVGFLTFAAAAPVAMALAGRGRTRVWSRARAVVDGVIVACSLGALTWATALGRTITDGADSALALVLSVAYPVGDVIVLAVAVLLLARTHLTRQLLLLALGAACMAVADSAFVYLTAVGSYSTGGPVDAVWALAFLLIALAPRQSHPDLQVRQDRSSSAAVLLPYVLVVAAFGTFAATAWNGGTLDRVQIGIGAVLVLTVIVRTVSMVLGNAELLTELDARQRQLARLAYEDPLTGVANRAAFTERLSTALEELPARHAVAVAFCDLDEFKAVNDSHGHAAGDELLRAVASRLLAVAGPRDVVARLGGDEFAVMVTGPPPGGGPEGELQGSGGQGSGPAAGGAVSATGLHARLCLALSTPVPVSWAAADPGGQGETPLQASVGAACSADLPAPVTGQALLHAADQRMYSAKRAAAVMRDLTRNGAAAATGWTVGDLWGAIESGQIEPWFQPQVDLACGAVVGYEALARWTRRDGETVPPLEFIPVAERHGLIGSLGERVLAAALAVGASQLPATATVSVNVSPVQLVDPLTPLKVMDALSAAGMPPERLCLEVTESALRDLDATRRCLTALRERGVTIAVDDFGAGHSALSHLTDLPVDWLKIDRSFVSRMPSSPSAAAVVEAVVGLAQRLGLYTIAEGVEDEQQRELLAALGCDAAQGWLLGRPVPAAMLPARSGSSARGAGHVSRAERS